jgi:hypothetical protein
MTKRSQGLRRPMKAKRSQELRKPMKAKRPLKGSARMSGTKKAKSATMDFRGAVLEQLSGWAADDPTAEVIAPASIGSKALTRSDLHSHVKKRTKFGNQLVDSWVKAALRNVMFATKK